MKRFASIALAFAAFSGIALIVSVIAQTSSVVAQTQEDAASTPLPPARQAPPSRSAITTYESRKIAQCAPDDRKCEVEHKLKGLVFDPREVSPRKGKGF
jgi:hypothetical protein